MREFWQTLKQSVKEFGEDKVPRLAAALAYYTVFSLAPLLIIVIAVAGLVFGSEQARNQLVDSLQQSIGSQAAGLIETMVENASERGSGVLAMIIGIVALLVGATGAFAQLQMAMNEIWDSVAERSRGLMHVLVLRLRGLGMVLVLGLLLVLSFVLQASLNVITSNFSGLLPGGEWLWLVLNWLVTLAILTGLFAALFKVVPDVELAWSDVWRGALLTAILFKLGEVAISFYIGTSGVRSTYGAAGSLVVLLLWLYFSAQIVLFGAEFTQVDSRRSEKRRLSKGKP